MARPHFVVALADLERGPKRVLFRMPLEWLKHAFAETEATPTGEGELDVELTRTGRDVMVRGRAQAAVSMTDARTLEPFPIELAAEIFLLLSQAPDPEAHRGRRRRAGEEPRRGRAQAKPPARDPKRGGWEETPELEQNEAARDTFIGEQIVLDSFVREFLLLELPMVPLRSDLPTDGVAAIAPPSPPPAAASAEPGGDAKSGRIDPRLAPLAAIASRLKAQKE
jgi:uncharacterized protein